MQKYKSRYSSFEANRSPSSSSRNSVKRRSVSREGNYTLDAFNFMSKDSEIKKADPALDAIDSGGDYPTYPVRMKRSRQMLKPRRSSARLRTEDSIKLVVQDGLKNPNGNDLTKTWAETGSVSTGKKRSYIIGDKCPNDHSKRKLKRQKSVFNAENPKAKKIINNASSKSPCRASKIIKPRKSEPSQFTEVHSQKKRTGKFRKSSGTQMSDKEYETATFEPLATKMEVDEPKTVPLSLFGYKLWTDQYSPSALSDMVLNSSDVSSLVSWMKMWDSRSNLSRRKTSSLARRSSSNQFSCNEDSYGSSTSGSLSSWRHSAYLILGPSGCGKTCLVYTLASQFGFKV